MAIEWTTLIEGGIPILGGLYATALGYGAISRSQLAPSPRTLKTRKQLRWLGPLVVLFGLFVAWQAHVQATHPSAEQLVQQIRSRMKFPVRLDDVTQLVAVEGKGDSIIYELMLGMRLADLGGKEAGQQKLNALLLKSACANKDYATVLRRGYTIGMHYAFQDSAEGVLVSIAPRTCGY